MSCSIALRTGLLAGAPIGGSWLYAGYHPTSASGNPGSGGTSFSVGSGDNPVVNFSGFAPGFYFFDYAVGGFPCNSVQRTFVQVAPHPSAGNNGTGNYCVGDNEVIELASIISGEEPAGTWSILSGSPPAGSFNASAGIFNISNVQQAGTFQFLYTVTVAPQNGTTLADCADCERTSIATVILSGGEYAGINTTLNVCSGDDVNIYQLHVQNQPGTITLGGDWLFTGWNDDQSGINTGQTFGVNGITSYRSPFSVVASGAATLSNLPDGYYYFFYRVGTQPCTDAAFVTVLVEPCCAISLNMSYNAAGKRVEVSVSGCTGAPTYFWEYRPNSTSAWASTGSTNFWTTVQGNGQYRVTVSCDGCQETQTYNLST